MLLKLKIFVEDSFYGLLSFLRMLVQSRFFPKVPKTTIKEVVILGNGPSLNTAIRDHRDFLEGKELICVNHFPSTDFYTELKPKFYITSAPDLWQEDIDQRFIDGSNTMFSNMNERTSWDMTLLIPYEAKKFKRWQNHIKDNQHIRVVYYNNIATEGYTWFRHLFFNLKWGMPRPHNIMIPAMMNSIHMGFKTIYLWGADHSWLPEITVTENNDVLLNQKHFYDEKTSKAETLDKRGKGQRALHEILHKFMLAFAGYFVIKQYAETKNVRILNTTKDSFIDAFERLSLDDTGTKKPTLD